MRHMALVAVLLAVGCGKSEPKAGSERGPCYGNGSCDDGLICRSEICVEGLDELHREVGKVEDEFKKRRDEALRERDKAMRAADERRIELDQLAREQAQLQRDLDSASTEAERQEIRQKLVGKQSELDKLRRGKQREAKKRAAKEREKIKLKCDPSDPLCGI